MTGTVTLRSSRGVARGPLGAARLAACAALAAAGLLLAGQGAWIHAKAVLAQVLLERAFAQSLVTGVPVKPWSWFDSWPVARIEIPRLSLDAVALAGASGQALAFGPAHVAGTPEPGERGTAVFAAHRDTHFHGLGAIRIGDEIRVTRRDGRRATFTVTRTEIVQFDRSGINPYGHGRELVLATCWPLDAVTPGRERFLVHAVLSEDDGRR
jgi:sortase A